MVDFLKVKISRLSDSVVLQHLWNSIDDLVLCGVIPSKSIVIERCKTTYEVEINEINKNLFLALKEGTISRNVKTDVLSRIKVKEDKGSGDWYCFLCHKVGPNTCCRQCGTSFHNNCNSDLSDEFHCHTCLLNAQFCKDFQKFSSTTQLRIIRRVIYSNKIKWQSLNIIGYIEDDSRNNFFIYKIINAAEIDKRLSLGKYFLPDKTRENFLFDLLLLRHNCAVIYGIEHEFSRTITGYIKHLNTEIENIYCESCFLSFSRVSNQKLSSSKKHELFCSVCTVQHPIMWGLVPPNMFWPFKLISEDKERYYGIKFSKPIHINRLKVESFSKEISLIWTSYRLEMCDRPSLELLKAFSLAQLYAQNLSEAQNLSNSTNVTSSIRANNISKHKVKVPKISLQLNDKIETPRKKVGRPSKVSVSCQPKTKVNCQSIVELDYVRKSDDNYLKKSIVDGQSTMKIVCSSKVKVNKLAKVNLGSKSKVKLNCQSKSNVCHIPKRKVGRPPIKNIVHPLFDKKAFLDNLSSSDSSSENINCLSEVIYNPKKRKRIKDVFISDDEKPAKISKSITKHHYVKRKGMRKEENTCLSSTDSESNGDPKKCYESNVDENNASVFRLNNRNHKYMRSFYSSRQTSHLSRDKNRNVSRYLPKHKKTCKNSEIYSSDDTIPQRASYLNQANYANESQSGSEIHEALSYNDIKYRKISTRHRSHCNFPISKKYSAYSTSASQSYNCTSDGFLKNHSKDVYMENSHHMLSSNGKDLSNSLYHSGNIETGRYCSSGSPVNFSPISITNNHQNTAAQFSMQ